MRSKEFRELATVMRNQGKSYGDIARTLNVSKQSARNLCNYQLKINKKKSGPKQIISGFGAYRIGRQIRNLKMLGEKVTTTKIINNCNIKISKTTCWRTLNRIGYKCRKAAPEIVLTKKHKVARVTAITQWISERHNWHQTVFSDEKRFSLDGPDSWCTYVKGKERNKRQIRQCEGGGLLVWAMIMPNGLISHKIFRKTLNSANYLCLLKEQAIPIMKLNFSDKYWFQQDNAAVHTAKIIKKFFVENQIKTLKWPAKSPDINITEDVWRMISALVYDGPQYQDLTALEKSINAAIFLINSCRRQGIMDLYDHIVPRLINILRKNGNLFNK